MIKFKSVHVYSGRRLRLRESTELSSFETGSRSEGSFLPSLRPVRVPATREHLRHNCNYASWLYQTTFSVASTVPMFFDSTERQQVRERSPPQLHLHTTMHCCSLSDHSYVVFVVLFRSSASSRTRLSLRHNCTYATLLRQRMHDHTSVSASLQLSALTISFWTQDLALTANPFLHRPFPFLPDWFHGLSDHLMILLCSTAGFVCMVC